MIKYVILLAGLVLFSCETPIPTAEEVIQSAIDASRTDQLRNASVSFIFRGITYSYQSKDGLYTYTRAFKDADGMLVKDILSNDSFRRLINGKQVQLSEKETNLYSASVNSVIYFAFLPVWLQDDAVNASHEGLVALQENEYHKIKVTFKKEGGGEDHDDVFYYWFDAEDFSLDYLAYSYAEEDGVGMRFRVAVNARKVNGIVFQDYINFKPKVKGNLELTDLGKYFSKNKLVPLSKIELEDVQVDKYE